MTQIITLNNKLLIGRAEWCSLPALSIPMIKAKIDTGARTSSLHAFNIKRISIEQKDWVQFDIHPIQGQEKPSLSCMAAVIDKRYVISSNGHKEHRYVISTPLILGKQKWMIQLTLSNRDPLKYRMLLGREALNGRVYIDPHLNCIQGKISKKKLLSLYK